MAEEKTLSVVLDLDLKAFSKKLKVATKGVSKSAKKMGKAFDRVGKKLSISIALPATIAGIAMLKLASDAQEVGQSFDDVFGASTKKAEKNISALSRELGRGKTQLKGFAVNMGSILQNMGFTSDEATDLSTNLIGLGVDVASFKNVSDPQAIKAFTGALVGEREALKTLGVSIKESDVKQEAFNLGLSDGKSELTKRAQAIATASLLQKNFSTALGRTKKEQDGFAGSLKKFNATLKTMGETFGKLILPVATDFLKIATTLADRFSNLDNSTKIWVLSLGAVAIVLPPLIIGVGSLITAFGAILPLLGPIAGAMVGIVAPLLLMGVAVIAVIGAWDDLVSAGKLLVENLFAFFDTGIGKIVSLILFPWIPMVKLIFKAFTSLQDGSKSWVQNMGNILIKLVEGVANFLVAPFIAQLNLMIFAYNTTIGRFGKKIKFASFTPFTGTAKIAFKKVKEFGVEAFKGIKQKTVDLWGDLKLAGGQAIDTFAEKFSKGLKTIGIDVDSLKNKLKGLLPDNRPFGVSGGQIGPAEAPRADPLADLINKGKGQGNKKSIVGGDEPDTTAMEDWIEKSQNINERFNEMWAGSFETFSSGIGDAFAGAIVDGENLAETMKTLMTDMVKSIISQLIKMGLQWVISSAMAKTASNSTANTVIANNAVSAGSGAASSQAGIPIVGPILAIIAMGAMIASVMALQGRTKMATGGITTGPTNALIGEAGQEAVIPLDKLDNMMGAREQTIIMNLDSTIISKSVIKNSPRLIRLNTGVLM